jgi:hypothetical protein
MLPGRYPLPNILVEISMKMITFLERQALGAVVVVHQWWQTMAREPDPTRGYNVNICVDYCFKFALTYF